MPPLPPLRRQRRQQGDEPHAAQQRQQHAHNPRAGASHVRGVQHLRGDVPYGDEEEGATAEEQQRPDHPRVGFAGRERAGGRVGREGGEGGGERECEGVEEEGEGESPPV